MGRTISHVTIGACPVGKRPSTWVLHVFAPGSWQTPPQWTAYTPVHAGQNRGATYRGVATVTTSDLRRAKRVAINYFKAAES